MSRFDPYPWLKGERISQFLNRVVVKYPAEDAHGYVAKKLGGSNAEVNGDAYS